MLDALIGALVSVPLNPGLYRQDGAIDRELFYGLLSAITVLGFAYLVAFDGGTKGATPGKRIVGIRVVDEASGMAIGYRRAVIRRLTYVVGGLVLYLGWLWLLFDRRRQAWHDKAARSVVIRTR